MGKNAGSYSEDGLIRISARTRLKIPANLEAQTNESVRGFLLRAMTTDQSDAAIIEHLKAMDATDLLITWFNWSWRMIAVHPRQVHLSREFVANPLRQRYSALPKLLTDIHNGVDLKKYLSRGVLHVTTPRSSAAAGTDRKRSRHIDPMLNAWGIYHLHIGNKVDRDGFVGRTKDLLFVVFRRGYAFVLDIMPHGAWARESLIRIILGNWPQAQLVDKLEGVIGLSRPIDDDERLVLMQNHINTAVEIDGAVYMPQGGIMASGVPMGAVRSADWTMQMIEDFIERVRADPAFLVELMRSRGIAVPDELKLNFLIDDSGFGLIEPQSKTLFKLHDFNSPDAAEGS